MTGEVDERLRDEFSGYKFVGLGTLGRIDRLVTPRATVVIAGGDGTVGAVVRRLANSHCRIGIIPLGTFNNFADALRLPEDLGAAIEVLKSGRARSITLGRVNGVVFLEACAIGLFGEVIRLGESAKVRRLRGIGLRVRNVLAAKPFKYTLSKDLVGSGTAMSLVFSNTYSTGIRLPLGDTTPADRFLEFSLNTGSTHLDIAGRALASAVLAKHREDAGGHMFRFRKLGIATVPRVRAYADHVPAGHTPLTVTAELSKLKFILPKR